MGVLVLCAGGENIDCDILHSVFKQVTLLSVSTGFLSDSQAAVFWEGG